MTLQLAGSPSESVLDGDVELLLVEHSLEDDDEEEEDVELLTSKAVWLDALKANGVTTGGSMMAGAERIAESLPALIRNRGDGLGVTLRSGKAFPLVRTVTYAGAELGKVRVWYDLYSGVQDSEGTAVASTIAFVLPQESVEGWIRDECLAVWQRRAPSSWRIGSARRRGQRRRRRSARRQRRRSMRRPTSCGASARRMGEEE